MYLRLHFGSKKKTKFLDNSSTIIDVFPVFFEPKWRPTCNPPTPCPAWGPHGRGDALHSAFWNEPGDWSQGLPPSSSAWLCVSWRCCLLLRSTVEWGGGSKTGKFMKQKTQINSVGWQHTKVDNNKTNKAQASRFCSTASHHSGGRGAVTINGN